MKLVEYITKKLKSADPELTDYRIAVELGVPQSAFRILRDRTENPKLDTIVSLFRLAHSRLGMTAAQFLELCDEDVRKRAKKRLGAR